MLDIHVIIHSTIQWLREPTYCAFNAFVFQIMRNAGEKKVLCSCPQSPYLGSQLKSLCIYVDLGYAQRRAEALSNLEK